jgi:hypothetical protein
MKPSRSSQETKLQGAIVGALEQLGFWVERINSGLSRPMHSSGVVHLAGAGCPDLLVVWPYFWVEVKDLEKMNQNQIEWHARAKKLGVPVIVARSVGEVVREAMARKAAA